MTPIHCDSNTNPHVMSTPFSPMHNKGINAWSGHITDHNLSLCPQAADTPNFLKTQKQK